MVRYREPEPRPLYSRRLRPDRQQASQVTHGPVNVEMSTQENSARNAEGLCVVGEVSKPKRFLINMSLSYKGERQGEDGEEKTEKTLMRLGLFRIPA